jgi:hypothetical protein
VIDLPLAAGNRADLDKVNNAAISQAEATRRFGTDQVLGRTLTLISKGQKWDFKIVSVMKDLPKNTHLRINALVNLDVHSFMAKEPQALTCWGCQNGFVYARLRPGADVKAIEASFRRGRSATSRTRIAARRISTPATTRTGTSSTSRHPSRQGAGRRDDARATTERRSSPSRSSPC